MLQEPQAEPILIGITHLWVCTWCALQAVVLGIPVHCCREGSECIRGHVREGGATVQHTAIALGIVMLRTHRARAKHVSRPDWCEQRRENHHILYCAP